MKNEYIRKQDAVNSVECANGNITWAERDDCKKRLEELSPADVVPVVRCKECKFRENDDFCTGRGFPYQLVPDDGFCDKGGRKE